VSDHQGVEMFFELKVLVCPRVIVVMVLMVMCKMEVEPAVCLDPTPLIVLMLVDASLLLSILKLV
jgi:hypothetical protein